MMDLKQADEVMNRRMKWTDFQDGAVGILPCALMTVVITKEGDGFKVHFGSKYGGPFPSLSDAKREGLNMIRDILTECIINLGPWA